MQALSSYTRKAFSELKYVFKHALVQDVAYSSLLLKRRRSIHERIGQAIETLYRERLEEFYEILAYHYSISENSVQACKYLKLSGIKATKSSALWEAFRFFCDAINLLNSQPATPENVKEQIELRLLMASPMLSWDFRSLPEILQHGEKL
jgi:predicted ATPase